MLVLLPSRLGHDPAGFNPHLTTRTAVLTPRNRTPVFIRGSTTTGSERTLGVPPGRTRRAVRVGGHRGGDSDRRHQPDAGRAGGLGNGLRRGVLPPYSTEPIRPPVAADADGGRVRRASTASRLNHRETLIISRLNTARTTHKESNKETDSRVRSDVFRQRAVLSFETVE